MRKTASQTITVQAPISVALTINRKGYVGIYITYQAVVSDEATLPIDYHFVFGDGNTRDLTDYPDRFVSATKGYGNPGTYTFSVTVTDADGRTASDSDTVVIEDPVSISLAVDNLTPKIGEEIQLALDMGSGFLDGGYTWSLDPGDGSTPYTGIGDTDPYSTTQPHTYSAEGEYTAVLTVEDALGTAERQALGIRVVFWESLKTGYQTLVTRWQALSTPQKILVGAGAVIGIVASAAGVQRLRMRR